MKTTAPAPAPATTAEVVRQFGKIDRPKFVGFTYANEYEKAHVIVLLGVELGNVYRRDLQALKNAQALETEPVRAQALAELVASYENSLEKGIGNNDAYTCADTYEHIGHGMKYHKEDGTLYVQGFTVRKTVLETYAPRPTKNSAEKTKAKNSLKRRYTRMDKFRMYKIQPESMKTVSANGNRLIIA